MFDVSYLSALIGGLLTFLAPCTLPLVPAFIAYIGGNTRNEDGEGFHHHRLFKNALMFVLGFTFIFVLFGVVSGALGKFLIIYRSVIAQAGGVIIILLGFSMLGLSSFPRLSAFVKMPALKFPSFIKPGSGLGGFVLGTLFALGWSPCLGPVLGTILLLAGASATAVSGGLLLLTYSIGLAIPFLIVAYVYGKTFSYVVTLQKHLPLINKIGAVMIIMIGFLLLIGEFGILNSWAAKLLGDVNFERFVEYM